MTAIIPRPERVLTLTEPYAYFVLRLPEEHRKNVENRTRNIGFFTSFWISTSAHCTPEEFDAGCETALRAKVPEALLPKREDLVLGAVVGKVWCPAMVNHGDEFGGRRWLPGDIPSASFRQIRGAHDYVFTMPADDYRRALRWYFGQFGYLLPEAQAIEPVPCKGNRGFWRPDAELEAKLRGR